VGIPGQAVQALAKHEALLRAVEEGDGAAARRAMQAHMEAEGDHLRVSLALQGKEEKNGEGMIEKEKKEARTA
jgi:DNA-binding GntR family transcriptional regulator